MQIVYHIGAHCTDEDRLLRCLLKNTERLHKLGTAVPGPSRYRKLISQALAALAAQGPQAISAKDMLDQIAQADDISRLVMSFEGFSAGPKQVFRDGLFYGRLERQVERLAMLFGKTEVEFHMAIRNPVTFVNAFAQRPNTPDINTVLAQIDPARVMWSDTVRQITEACPNARVVIWCDEDAPLVWGDVLHSLAGLEPDAEDLIGCYDFLASLLTKDGYEKFTRRLVDSTT